MLPEWIANLLRTKDLEKKFEKEWQTRITAESRRNLCNEVADIGHMFKDYRDTVGIESRVKKMKKIYVALGALQTKIKVMP